MSILQDPILRTRRLYRWEDDFTFSGNVVYTNEKAANEYAQRIWDTENWGKRYSCPKISLRKHYSRAYCLGRSLIVLTLRDRRISDLIHELVHARGYGSWDKDPHNEAFVRKYTEILSYSFGLDHNDMVYAAKDKGLL